MEFQFVKILTVLLCQLYSSFAHSAFVGMKTCVENKTIAIQVLATEGENPTYQCQVAPISDPDIRGDYTYFPGLGGYKFHTLAQSWNDARKICNEENAHLAIINSKPEEKVMLDILQKESKNVLGAVSNEFAFLGLHDMFKEGDWVTVFGESIYSTGYTEWSTTCLGSQPDNNGGNQNCAVLIKKCGTMDDANCNIRLPFFCEKPIPCAVQTSVATSPGLSLDERRFKVIKKYSV